MFMKVQGLNASFTKFKWKDIIWRFRIYFCCLLGSVVVTRTVYKVGGPEFETRLHTPYLALHPEYAAVKTVLKGPWPTAVRKGNRRHDH